MTTLVIIVLSLLLVLLGTVCFYLFKLVNIQLNKLSVYEDWILTVRKDAHGVYTQMKELDTREIFRKDDEVGVVFQDLVELIEWLNKRVLDEEE